MADYDWGKPCCGELFGHKVTCKEHPRAAEFKIHGQKRAQGYHWDESTHAYKCRRGCGTLVWDTDAHTKNVCREFNPVAG